MKHEIQAHIQNAINGRNPTTLIYIHTTKENYKTQHVKGGKQDLYEAPA